MSILSIGTIIFMAAVLAVYFLTPGRYRWFILLVSSMVFYAMSGAGSLIFIGLTSVTVYFSAIWLEKDAETAKTFLKEHKDDLPKDERERYKKKDRSRRRLVLVVTLVINFGTLAVFKYFPVNEWLGWITPLGISFYTFQATGYLVDVYWKQIPAEKNWLKELLFVSFFPQIIQGPISSFGQLSKTLYAPNAFDYDRFAGGFRRLLIGYIKKVWLADSLWTYVDTVMKGYGELPGFTVLLGIFMYSVWIYADFSGYMDIMCGYCEMLGITLPENFDRPYFSHSVAEYWRRWHMTLGEWFKKYIYYPVAVSGWNQRIGGFFKKRGHASASKNIMAAVALIVTWGATGIWHGNTAGYMAWGLINGAVIILSIWLEPMYTGINRKLRINTGSLWYRSFQVIRTFFVVAFIKILPELDTLGGGFGMWKRALSGGLPHSYDALFPGGLAKLTLLLAFVFFVAELIQGKRPLRPLIEKLPMGLRIALTALVFVLFIALGIPEELAEGGFAYAGF